MSLDVRKSQETSYAILECRDLSLGINLISCHLEKLPSALSSADVLGSIYWKQYWTRSDCSLWFSLIKIQSVYNHDTSTVIPVLSGHSKKHHKIGFQDRLSLNAGQKYSPKGSILQYFPPSLSYHLSLRSVFCLFLSGRLRQVLL